MTQMTIHATEQLNRISRKHMIDWHPEPRFLRFRRVAAAAAVRPAVLSNSECVCVSAHVG